MAKKSAFPWFSILAKMGLTFLETWHHENFGGQPDFQNIWLETARPGWIGLSPPWSRKTSPALTRMSSSVFGSATSLLFLLSIYFQVFATILIFNKSHDKTLRFSWINNNRILIIPDILKFDISQLVANGNLIMNFKIYIY